MTRDTEKPRLQRAGRIICALLLLAPIAGCGQLPKPFQAEPHDHGPRPLLDQMVRESVGIAIMPVEGAPPGIAEALREAIAGAAQARDIAGMAGPPTASSYRLSASLDASFVEDGIAYKLTWSLTDAKGTAHHRFEHQETAHGDGQAAPWEGADGALIDRLAQVSADALQSWLDRQAEMAGAADQAMPGDEMAKPINAAHQPPALVVQPVTGAPGNGGPALTKALRLILLETGLPVVEQPVPLSFVVTGEVTVTPKDMLADHVALIWTVKTSEGEKLGAITQNNEVPAGSLHGRWGNVANLAAYAAAAGILDLLQHYGLNVPQALPGP